MSYSPWATKSWTRLNDWTHTQLAKLFIKKILNLLASCQLQIFLFPLTCESVSSSVASNSLWHYGLYPPGSSVHGILQVRTGEWVAVPFSRGSSRPVDWTWVSCIAGRFFTIWVTRNATNMWKKKGTLCLEIHELKNTNKTKSREDYFDQRKLLLLMPGLLKATCEKDLLISTWRITS